MYQLIRKNQKTQTYQQNLKYHSLLKSLKNRMNQSCLKCRLNRMYL